MTAVAGARLGGRYILEERIAGGGMGEVWRARDDVLHRPVAVKALRREYADDPQFLERFRAEARHMAMLSHPGIAGVFDYGESDGTPYLVMELVDGEPLSAVLAREGRLPPAQVLDIVGQAALALQAAHEAGVVHRDVKPANLLLRRDGTVKVTDFGIARAAGAVPLTQTGTVVGTAHYISPEQARGGQVSPAADIYALGVVAYECLAGERPFTADSPVAVAMAHLREEPPRLPSDVPQPVQDLVLRAMAKDPERRYPDAGELGRTALALAPLVAAPPPAESTTVLPAEPPPAAEPIRALRPYTRERPLPGQRRMRNRMIAAGAVVVLCAALMIWLLTPDRATVPAVQGKPVAQAVAALQKAGFEVRRRTVHDARHPAGLVLRETPAGNTAADKGSTVTLDVASGPLLLRVDPQAYVGKPYAQVAAALKQRGLGVARTTRASGLAAGTVLAVTPSGSVREGTTVTVTVAVAPPPAPAPAAAPQKNDKRGKGKGHEGD